jgi:hypothetical protein
MEQNKIKWDRMRFNGTEILKNPVPFQRTGWYWAKNKSFLLSVIIS